MRGFCFSHAQVWKAPSPLHGITPVTSQIERNTEAVRQLLYCAGRLAELFKLFDSTFAGLVPVTFLSDGAASTLIVTNTECIFVRILSDV